MEYRIANNSSVSFRGIGAVVLLATNILVGGCAQGYPNRPLENWQPNLGYQGTVASAEKSRRSDPSDELLLMLAFSGGGTRAAAFSYDVLERLAQLSVQNDGRTTRFLDEVDAISSVSGGSFTFSRP